MKAIDELFSLGIPLLETFLRGSIIYLGLFFFLRFCLKRQASDLGVSDLLVIVLIADAFQNGMAPEQQTIADSFLMAGTILFWAFALDWLAFRFPLLERLMREKEVLLVKDGKLNRRNMRRELVTVEELESQMRLAGVEKISGIKLAHIEGDGKFSFVPYEESSGNKPETRRGV